MTTDNPDTVHTRDVTNHGASVPDHASTRDRQVWRTFVALADTLVADFDIADVLDLLTERSVELLEVSAAAVLLVAPTGGLEVVASTSERAEVLELFAVRTDDGPCIDCVRGGSPVGSADLVADSQRWPRFAAAAHACGFRSVHAVPLRRGTQVVGVLTLLGSDPGALADDDLGLGQALADIATIAILQHRASEHRDELTAQLQIALDTRVVIEQAKGVLAQRGGLSMDAAFTRLRAHARSHNQRLTDLARAITDSTAATADLDAILTPPN